MNLIICTTPFQILVALRIIEIHPNEQFYPLIIAPFQNNKYDLYANKIITKCGRGKIIYTSPSLSRIRYLYNAFNLRILGCYNKNIRNVFLASFDSLLCQLILSGLNKNVGIYTFDDGTINIVEDSPLLGDDEIYGIVSKFFGVALLNKFTTKRIRCLSKLHYSVYPGRKNVVFPVEYISIFNLLNKKNRTYLSNEAKPIRILLGQPVYELLSNLDEKEIKKLIEKLVEYYNVDYYFPHPRESYLIDNVKYICSELLFEDYLISRLYDNNIILYTFFSGAVFPFCDMNNIKIISIRPTFFQGELDGLYKLIADFNIPIDYIDITI